MNVLRMTAESHTFVINFPALITCQPVVDVEPFPLSILDNVPFPVPENIPLVENFLWDKPEETPLVSWLGGAGLLLQHGRQILICRQREQA